METYHLILAQMQVWLNPQKALDLTNTRQHWEYVIIIIVIIINFYLEYDQKMNQL